MKNIGISLWLLAGLLAAAVSSHAGEPASPRLQGDAEPITPVEYVRVCSLYGAGFYYIAGTDICVNSMTDDARQQTEGGTWRSRWPYPEGQWVGRIKEDCRRGTVVNIGKYQSTDFTLNPWMRKQTAPTALDLGESRFISRVYFSGGFYDPRIPNRSGLNGTTGLCLRSIDPTELEPQGQELVNPAFGNGLLPIACVANSRIVGMPAAYALDAAAAYPSIDMYFPTADQTVVAGPYLYGSHVVVTTDLGNSNANMLTYADTTTDPVTIRPLAGTLYVSVCVQKALDLDDVHGFPSASKPLK